MFAALQQLNADIVCVVPDLPADWADRYPSLRFLRDPVDLRTLLPEASLVVTHGSGTFADAIAAGVPVLMVPAVIEQYLAAVQLERQGFGLVFRDRKSATPCLALIQRILSDAQFQWAARRLADRYADFRPEQSVQLQFEALQSLLRTS